MTKFHIGSIILYSIRINGRIFLMLRTFHLFFGLLLMIILPVSAFAACENGDRLCVMEEIRKTADKIDNKAWRDKALRELAKSYTAAGYESKAIALIDAIAGADTKAMTIRGIGMAAADSKWKDKTRYTKLFDKLKAEADKIEHPPSYAIAYTYIVMAQAFAKDYEGAAATAQSMKNDALRHKAYAETAEIQAERGHFDEAMTSIRTIESNSFRNKAYGTVARIFTKRGQLDYAYQSAQKIENPYARAQILQNIIDYRNEEEEEEEEEVADPPEKSKE